MTRGFLGAPLSLLATVEVEVLLDLLCSWDFVSTALLMSVQGLAFALPANCGKLLVSPSLLNRIFVRYACRVPNLRMIGFP